MEVAEEEVAVRDVDAVHEVDRNVCRVAVFGLAHAQAIAAGRWAELRDLWRPICGAASQGGLARCGADQRKNDDQRKKEIQLAPTCYHGDLLSGRALPTNTIGLSLGKRLALAGRRSYDTWHAMKGLRRG